jgi:hypothetical protein
MVPPVTSHQWPVSALPNRNEAGSPDRFVVLVVVEYLSSESSLISSRACVCTIVARYVGSYEYHSTCRALHTTTKYSTTSLQYSEVCTAAKSSESSESSRVESVDWVELVESVESRLLLELDPPTIHTYLSSFFYGLIPRHSAPQDAG